MVAQVAPSESLAHGASLKGVVSYPMKAMLCLSGTCRFGIGQRAAEFASNAIAAKEEIRNMTAENRVESFTRRRSLLRLGVCLSGLPLLAGVEVGAASPRFGILGAQAPAINASYWIGADGAPTNFAMSETEDRWVYLKCFQAWCPGCHKHGLPALKTVVDAFSGDPRVLPIAVQTVFEGYSFNTRDKLREIQTEYGLPIKFGHDSGDPTFGNGRPQTMREYRTGGTPWVVIIDPLRRVVYNDYHIDADRFVDFMRKTLDA